MRGWGASGHYRSGGLVTEDAFDDGADGEALHADREEDDNVDDGDEGVAEGGGWEGEGHGDREAAAKSSPGEDGDGATGDCLPETQSAGDQEDAEVAGEESECDGDGAGEEVGEFEVGDEDLQANEDEEEGVENAVDEMPEGVEVLACVFGHGAGAALVADEDAGGDDGDGGGDVEEFADGVDAHGEGEGEEDFDLVFIDAAKEAVDEPSGGEPEGDAAAGFAEEEDRDMAGGGGSGAGGDFEEGDEEDDGDAIVEEGFAGHDYLDAPGGVGLWWGGRGVGVVAA